MIRSPSSEWYNKIVALLQVEALLEKAGIRKIDKVTVKADPNNIGKNRGFAFVELETCKAAHFALNKLQKNDAFGIIPRVQVTWAEHLVEPDEEEILKVGFLTIFCQEQSIVS